MALRKSELYKYIWEACNELRGGMDASQYKDYVLVLLFIRYISDKHKNDRSSVVEVPKGGSFDDLVEAKGKTDVGERINKALSKLAEANELKGVIDVVDFNDDNKLGSGKEKQERLSKLIAIFENPALNFSKNRAEGDDLLGDAYEYLMKNFATESGKSKGQFYTPAEVSRIMAKVVGAENAKSRTETVYDPTCGSGSLLLKVADEAPVDITIYGQEKDSQTAGLAILNMWLHGRPTADIRKGQSTLSNPLFIESGDLKRFDYIVSNPPFSYKSWQSGFNPSEDEYGRFDGFAIPPAKNGDYAFLLHVVKSLKSTGKGVVVMPHGVLFRGNTEGEIRKNLIKRGYIKGIIGLPANLFYGTGIPACLVIIDKEKQEDREGIFMIDGSNGYMKDGNKNRLRERDIRKIIDVWQEKEEVDGFSYFATNEEIEKNDYNLNLPRYIASNTEEDTQDIEGHLKGGIPEKDINNLSMFWEVCPSLKDELFKKGDRDGYYELKMPEEDISETVFKNREFLDFKEGFLSNFNEWKSKEENYLKNINKETRPKNVIEKASTSLLDIFNKTELVDNYNVYQHLMSYWGDVIYDDTHAITAEGWEVGKILKRTTKENQKKKEVEVKGLEGLEGQIVPISIVIDNYFKEEKKEIDRLQEDLEQTNAKMEEMKEEHAIEGGLLEEVINNSGNINKTEIKKRIREIGADPEFKDELEKIKEYSDLLEKEGEIKKELKEAKNDLEKKLINKYPELIIKEIKEMVVEQKWMKALKDNITKEVDNLAQDLFMRIKELSERYRETLPEIESETKDYSKKVEEHLNKMGFKID
jgi:type I restriction enzyme M protein